MPSLKSSVRHFLKPSARSCQVEHGRDGQRVSDTIADGNRRRQSHTARDTPGGMKTRVRRNHRALDTSLSASGPAQVLDTERMRSLFTQRLDLAANVTMGMRNVMAEDKRKLRELTGEGGGGSSRRRKRVEEKEVSEGQGRGWSCSCLPARAVPTARHDPARRSCEAGSPSLGVCHACVGVARMPPGTRVVHRSEVVLAWFTTMREGLAHHMSHRELPYAATP